MSFASKDSFGSISNDSTSKDSVDCAICLQTMRSFRNNITALPCAHCFHTSCIDKLIKHESSGEAKCPLCRQPITGVKSQKQPIHQPIGDAISQSLELDIQLHNLLQRRSERKRKRRRK